jgi:transposase
VVVRRHELTDEQWQAIQPLLPPSGTKGRTRVDDRRVINGMLLKAKTGMAWRDLPERHGPWKTVYTRFWRWSRDGTLSVLVERVRVIAEAIDELDGRCRSTPASCAPTSTPPAPARRGFPRLIQGAPGSGDRPTEPGDHAVGRSRAGPTTKIHLACDGHGRPLSVLLTGGNVNDCTRFTQVLGGVEFRRPARVDPPPDPVGCWPTRATPAAPTGLPAPPRHPRHHPRTG